MNPIAWWRERRTKKLLADMCRAIGHDWQLDRFSLRRECTRCPELQISITNGTSWMNWPI